MANRDPLPLNTLTMATCTGRNITTRHIGRIERFGEYRDHLPLDTFGYSHLYTGRNDSSNWPNRTTQRIETASTTTIVTCTPQIRRILQLVQPESMRQYWTTLK